MKRRKLYWEVLKCQSWPDASHAVPKLKPVFIQVKPASKPKPNQPINWVETLFLSFILILCTSSLILLLLLRKLLIEVLQFRIYQISKVMTFSFYWPNQNTQKNQNKLCLFFSFEETLYWKGPEKGWNIFVAYCRKNWRSAQTPRGQTSNTLR